MARLLWFCATSVPALASASSRDFSAGLKLVLHCSRNSVAFVLSHTALFTDPSTCVWMVLVVSTLFLRVLYSSARVSRSALIAATVISFF